MLHQRTRERRRGKDIDSGAPGCCPAPMPTPPGNEPHTHTKHTHTNTRMLDYRRTQGRSVPSGRVLVRFFLLFLICFLVRGLVQYEYVVCTLHHILRVKCSKQMHTRKFFCRTLYYYWMIERLRAQHNLNYEEESGLC